MQQQNGWDNMITGFESVQVQTKNDPSFRVSVEHWRVLQQEHLSKRRQRYAAILKKEVLYDAAVFKTPWTDPVQIRGPKNPSTNVRQMNLSTSVFPDGFPFEFKTIDDRVTYPLRWLSAYPAVSLSGEEQQVILQLPRDADWLETILKFWKGGTTPLLVAG
ncbi:hypothetical protein QTJ16_004379 [Diplocarpon rosae]|uniref:Uncharacterized protein n=1 Tax=Diplocarpon rosae TaxID=946125 RepID=A0AAD9WC65_9HELO|nr:hypothetical protein QTJ16_004379 [Diplocarpon rosae]